MSKKIPLTKGQSCIVDDEDYGWISEWKWYAVWYKSVNDYHAMRKVRLGPKKRRGYAMARQILGLMPEDPRWADHINGIPLDNRRENLRIVTPSENGKNHKISKRNKSGKDGVYFHKRDQQWAAYITVNRKRIYLGYHPTFLSACEARWEAERKHWGNLARNLTRSL